MSEDIKSSFLLIKAYWKEVIIISICSLFSVLEAFFRPLIVQGITDQGMLQKNYVVICKLGILLLVLIFCGQLFEIIQNRKLLKIRRNVIHSLSCKAFDKLLHLKTEQFIHDNSAEYIERLNTDIGSLGILFDQGFIYMLIFSMKFFAGVLGLIYINWKMSIFILGCIPVKLLLLLYFGRQEEKITSFLINENTEIFAEMEDTISGIREVKLHGLYNKVNKKYAEEKNKLLDYEYHARMISTYNVTTENLIQGFMTGVFYLYGGYYICKGMMSVGNILAFISYAGNVMTPLSMVMSIRMVLAQVKPSFERLNDFFKLETEFSGEINDGTDFSIKDQLSVKDLVFGYNNKTVLDGITFNVTKGEKIAIVGENGSGKSTLLNCILGFCDFQTGQILIDSRDIKTIDLEKYRLNFSVVLQFPYLFQDTVRRNLDFEDKYTDDEIIAVFKKLGMISVYFSLKKGLDTQIGVGATNISGGERQKLALIRAVLKNAPILILDECTSNYDVNSEKWLYTEGLNLFNDKMVIAIVHQFQYLKYFDKVYQMVDGRLVEMCKGKI